MYPANLSMYIAMAIASVTQLISREVRSPFLLLEASRTQYDLDLFIRH